MISPKLREDVGIGFGATTTVMNDYSPYSYIAAAILIFVLLTMSLYRTARK